MATAATTSAQKTRLTMVRYTVSDTGTISVDTSISFAVAINPADVKHKCGITYDTKKALGQAAVDPKFSAVEAENLSFSLVLDGTGVVPLQTGETRQDVKTQIDNLKNVVYKYEGSKHEPGRVRLLWGTLIFFGRMQSMSTQYTLFKPSGAPLRAKVELSFVGAMSKQENDLVSNLSSPDLSHIVEVRDGDTLPLLCNRIYGDPGYYLEVARFNQLTDFRKLVPGRTLHFPPLE
jgi:nucleoid-associated protein YgaU